MKYSFLALFIIIFSIISCGKEKFATKRVKDDFKTKDIQELDFPGKFFSRKTDVKPKVDFLFIWDNTSSILKTSDEHQGAMANTINLISDKFDYRMVISPLLGKDGIHPFWESYIVSREDDDILRVLRENPIDLTSRYRPPGEGYVAIFNIRDWGSVENGITRAFNLTKTGYEEGIFRPEAHMIIVMISNADDNSYIKQGSRDSEIDKRVYLKLYEEKFDSLRRNFRSNTFRFLSVVPHTVCEKSKDGSTYREMSERLFNSQKMLGYPATSFSSPPDTMDFCNIESFKNLFSGINATINPVDIPYTYKYWPITTDKNWIYDEDSIVVTKKDNNGKPLGPPIPKIGPDNLENGWSVVNGGYQTQNIIICPQHAQITCDMDKAKLMVAGQFIELHGTAQITNPDYLDIHSSAPQEYYGYIKMNYKPWIDPNKKLTESIRAKMDNNPLPEGSFEYIGWQKDKNVRVKSFTDLSEDSKNPLYQTGYFLKLNKGYGAGVTIQIDYWPSGSEH